MKQWCFLVLLLSVEVLYKVLAKIHTYVFGLSKNENCNNDMLFYKMEYVCRALPIETIFLRAFHFA